MKGWAKTYFLDSPCLTHTNIAYQNIVLTYLQTTFLSHIFTQFHIYLRISKKQSSMYQVSLKLNFSVLKILLSASFCLGSNDIQTDTLSYFVILLRHLYIYFLDISQR